MKIAAICDEFTQQCLKPECNLISFGPDDWKAIFEFNRPHLLFVESAWHGNKGKWTRKVAHINETNTLQLQELIDWCKSKDIPTVFWNKEDPVHFNSFIETAKRFDYIFTTDENSVQNYKSLVKHDRVFALPFAAQPKIHNPIQEYERIDKSCFAGSYYADKYIERQQDMNLLLESASNFGLDIYDRNYGKNLVQFYFPEHLRKFVVGSLKPSEISKAYKGYKIALNVNSVIDSPTMFSRRVFECLACNTPVVSTHSEGIKNILEDTVLMSKDRVHFDKIFSKLLNEEDYYKTTAHQGYRKVMLNHTYEARLKYVIEKVGFVFPEKDPIVNVISFVTTNEEMYEVIRMFNSQSYQAKQLTFITALNKQDLKSPDSNHDIQILTEEQFIYGFNNVKSDFYACFSAANEYGENYLQDILLAFKYSNSDVNGKGACYTIDGEKLILNEKAKEHSYVETLSIDAAILKREVFQKITKENYLMLVKNNGQLEHLFKSGCRLYSVDPFNFTRSKINLFQSSTASV